MKSPRIRTAQQAILLYRTIEALLSQFDKENKAMDAAAKKQLNKPAKCLK